MAQAAATVSAVALLGRDSLSRQRETCWQIINTLNPETVLFPERREFQGVGTHPQ